MRRWPQAKAASYPGGGDTLAIWRWQGKASRIKALTLMEVAGPDPRLILSLGPVLKAHACPAAHASRSCFFMTLPLALRGSGSDVSAIVSGTL
jgi:hypothetical protein